MEIQERPSVDLVRLNLTHTMCATRKIICGRRCDGGMTKWLDFARDIYRARLREGYSPLDARLSTIQRVLIEFYD
jgi:hypothetical protein